MSKNNQTLEVVSIKQIDVSKTNPRKSFDEKALQELADSIKEHGILQPVLVRPLNSSLHEPWEQFELVCGERRYRAAMLAGLEEIPVNIRVLTDEEAFEAQILENLQRENVSPLDEAKAFKSLMNKETLDWLASKINKSKKYVLDRIKLLDLCEYGMEALSAGALPLGHAVLLSKIDKEKQETILKKDVFYGGIKDLVSNRWKDLSQCHCTKTISQFKSLIESEAMLSFDRINFDLDDAELLPAAGSCLNCSKRTINQNLLFGDITSEDKCTDSFCFKAKIKKHTENQIGIAKKAFGDNVMTGEKDQWSSHGIIVNKERITFNDKKTEKYTIPVVINKVGNYYETGKLGKTVWIEDKEKEDTSKKESKPSGPSGWELRQAKEFDEVLVPRLEQLISESVSLPFATTKISRTYILEKLTSKITLKYLLVVAHFLKIKELESLSYFEIKKTTDATSRDEDFAMCFEIASEIIKRFPIELALTILAIDDLITDDFEEDESVEEWELTINKIYSALKLSTSEIPVEDIETEAVDLTEELENLLEEEIGEGSLAITSTLDIPTFEKITRKRFSLNNSYFKNRTPQMPGTPIDVMYYYKQHGELPFDMDVENNPDWLYECFVEYQKRAGVYGSRFFTPPATAKRMAELADEYFYYEEGVPQVLDACCGFGMLTKPLLDKGFIVNGFDINKELLELYNEYTSCISEQKDIHAYLAEDAQWKNIVSNPPYEIKECTQFLKLLWDLLTDDGTAILLLPKGFVDKDKPKALVEVLGQFEVVYREDIQEDFARTGIKAEIVVLRKS